MRSPCPTRPVLTLPGTALDAALKLQLHAAIGLVFLQLAHD